MRASLLTVALVALALMCSEPAAAHNLSVAHVDVSVAADDPQAFKVEIDLALKDLALTLPLDRNRDEAVTWGELQAARTEIEALVVDAVGVAGSTGTCTLQPMTLATRRYDDGAYATLTLAGQCTGGSPMQLRYGLFFDRDPAHRAIVTFRSANRLSTAVARADARTLPLNADVDHSFAYFLREGVHHILIGYDHLAFLLSLILPALLVWNGTAWRAGGSVRRQLWPLMGIVTAFTLAHSVTLTLAALGWITPMSRWVEACIAASVLLAALNNVRPLVTRRLWLVSFGFGLIHGFGFAGALSELGLPQDARLLALLGFNLGVEAGQLAVVTALLPLLIGLRSKSWYARWVLPGVSLLLAAVAAWWLWQRLSG